MRRARLGLAIALTLLACRTAAIHDVVDSPVPEGSLSSAEVGEAIQHAAASRGWSTEAIGPDRLLATLRVRRHRATVEITYSTQAFSITYRDSENLRAEGGQIHRNYNGWVIRLERAIRDELLRRTGRPPASSG